MDEDAEGIRDDAHQAAFAMLDSFCRAHATGFDLTVTDIHGQKLRFRSKLLPKQLRALLPGLLDNATRHGHNVIVRPRSSQVFVQLDDLDADKLDRVLLASFLALETSPGNFQAWLVLPPGSVDEDFARRLRKGAGADPTASGATRVAGSLNFKDKYAPDFPRVAIAHDAPGRIATRDQLEALGLVAAPEPVTAPAVRPAKGRARPGPGSRRWPDYERCLQGAPPNHGNTGPDVSRADFAWCMIALDWEWSIEATAAQLMQVSPKAQENGERYALLTAENAAAAVARRRAQGRG